jgi:flavin-dependent dehydrogenase
VSDSRFDALVIGGGPAGGTAALLLAQAGWSVGLMERKRFPRRKVCGEYLSASNGPLLKVLGITSEFEAIAGPPLSRVGLFAGQRVVTAELPRFGLSGGRALSRERLDALLLDRARLAGAAIIQPASAESMDATGDGFRCIYRDLDTRQTSEVRARVVVLAHGSWDRSGLPTQCERLLPRPGDLLAFKAHFREGALPIGLMPLLVFPGGYGGMVHVEGGRFSASCCIRRDRLEGIRRDHPDGDAGEAVQAHLVASLKGFGDALRGAVREGPWLAAGPIQPGVRLNWRPGLYPVGNAAGEAHPVIAEGISIAMQSAWLLVQQLIGSLADSDSLTRIGERYEARWRRAFVPRLRASAAIAQWAMSPLAVNGSLPFIRLFPRLLTLGARLSGKVQRIVSPEASGSTTLVNSA